MLQLKDKHNNTLMVELSSDGNYWNINTAGIFKETYGKNRKEVYSRHTTAKQSAETVEASQEVEQSGTQTSSSMNAPASLKSQEVSLHPNTQVEESVPLNETNRPTITDNQPALLGINSSDFSNGKDTDKSAVKQTIGEKVSQAEAETEQNPTEAQKEAGNYKKGHVRIGQFDITVENPKGSVRRGTDQNGNSWETTMHNTYGYIRGTEGVDGDHIDVFLTDDIDGWNGRRVYVIDQYNEDGTFDEHKVMLGFNDEDDARNAYFANYSDDWADKRKIVMTSANLEDFEKWIDSSHRKTKPFAEYKSVNKTNEANVTNGPNAPEAGFEIAPAQYTTKRGRRALSAEEAALRNAVVDRLRESGLEVITDAEEGQRVLDEANGRNVRLNARKKRILETALPKEKSSFKGTVVSSIDGAKILKSLDNLVKDLEEKSNRQKTFIGDVAKALGADRKNKSSQYATFETQNGKVVTIRISNHNATVSNFEQLGEEDGVSIVISRKPNNGVTNDGGVHIVEFFYSDKAIAKADGKPLAEIVKSIKQALYSGEYKDTTGLAEVEEVNGEVLREHRVYHGSAADFEAFDHSHMGEGEGAQAYGWGSYVTEVKGIGKSYATSNEEKMARLSISEKKEYIKRRKRDIKEMGDYERYAKKIMRNRRNSEKEYKAAKKAGNEQDMRFYEDLMAISDSQLKRENHKALIDSFYDDINKAQSEIDELEAKFKGNHHLYTVEIPEDTGGNYLDWDKPVTKEQQGKIYKQLRDEKTTLDGATADFWNGKSHVWDSGREFYSFLDYCFIDINENNDSQKAASEFLSRAGFTGIRYPAEYRSGGRSDGARNYVIFNENDLKITDHVRFFRTHNGEAYGFTVGGKIYIDPRVATADTPIHEYAHLWASALRQGNPEEWRNVVGLMKGTPAWDEVKGRYPELETDDEIADEVLATYSGRRGAERLREKARKAAGGGSALDMAEAMSAMERVRVALRRFWKGVADFLHIHYTTAEDVADRVMGDLLEGVNPAMEADGPEGAGGGRFGRAGRPNGTDEPVPERRRQAALAEQSRQAEEAGEVEARNVETRLNLSPEERRQSLAEETEDVARDDQTFLQDAFGESESNRTNVSTVEEGIEDVNERFNEELQRYQDGEMDKNEMFHLGMPQGVMRMFLPNLPIVMRQRVVNKGSNRKHDVDVTALQDMPERISEPIFVFKKNDSTVGILTEMKDRNGRNVFVAFDVDTTIQDGGKYLEVNNITTVHGRRTANIIRPILENNSLKWVNKEKALDWFSSASPDVQQEITNQELSDATKIVKNFENPRAVDGNLREGEIINGPNGADRPNAPRRSEARRPSREREERRMAQRVKELAETLHLDNVDIVTDASTLQGARAKAKGFFSRGTGRITIVIPNHTSVYDAEQTLLHEAVAHYGLRQLFGEHFDTFLDNVFQNAEKGIQERIAQIEERLYQADIEERTKRKGGGVLARAEAVTEANTKRRNGDYRKAATEEYLASLAEDTNFENINASWWQKIKELFLRMLHKIGFEDFSGVTLSDNELRYILWRSYENLAEPGRYRSILGEAEDVAKQYGLKVGNYAANTSGREADTAADIAGEPGLDEANGLFNEQLDGLTEGNADSVTLSLGRPSAVLRAAGVEDKPMKLYGNKVIKKMKKHGFSLEELKDLPRAVADPIAVFNNYQKEGNRSILTELQIGDKHILASITVGKAGVDADFNIVSSVFGKGNNNIVDWINKGYATYINIEKTLDYLHFSERSISEASSRRESGKALNYLHHSALKAVTSDNQELISAANIVKNFENPKVSDGNVLYRESGGADGGSAGAEAAGEPGAASRVARRMYEEAVRDTGSLSLLQAVWFALRGGKEGRVRFMHKFAESYFDYSRSVKALQDAISHSLGRKLQDFERPWEGLNAKSSVDSVELQEMMLRYLEPLSRHIGAMVQGKRLGGKGITLDDVEKYMNAKHGPERNAHLAERELSRLGAESLEKWRARETLKLQGDGYSREESEAIAEGEAGAELLRLRKELWPKVRHDYAGLTALFGGAVGDKGDVEALEAAARGYCSEFERAVGAEAAAEMWRMVRALNGFSLRKAYLSGLVGKEQYDEVSGQYDYYVPLRGWHDDYAGDVYQYISRGTGGDALQSVLKSAYGRKSRAGAILGTMAAMANTAIVQGNRNLVGQRLLNLALNAGESGLLMVTRQWYEKGSDGEYTASVPTLRDGMSAEEMQSAIEEHDRAMSAAASRGGAKVVHKAFGKEFPLHAAKWEERQHGVRVLRNGREYMVYVLGTPKATQALSGLLNPDVDAGPLEAALMRYLRYLARIRTSLSPEFPIQNFQRDLATSMAGTYVKHGPGYAGRYGVTLWKVLPGTGGPGIFGLLRKYRSGRLDLSVPMERMFMEFMSHGGKTGISEVFSTAEYGRKVGHMVGRARRGRVADAPEAAWLGLLGGIQFLNDGIENATRFAAYVTARDGGASVGEAISEAKEASVNFNMKGSGAWGNLWMRRYIIFSNAALQSLRMLGTWYGASPRRFMGLMSATMSASFAMALAWWSLGGGDDDDDDYGNKWYGLSEWDRYNYVNVHVPGGYLHWSIPQELRPVWALGQVAFDWQRGRIGTERALHSMAQQLNNLTPVSFIAGGTDTGDSWITTAVRGWTPTVAADFMDAYIWNEDFLGRPITGQHDWNVNAPEWQRVTDDTPGWAVGLSRRWNEATGGREHRKSWWDSEWLNPGALYHLLSQQTGGLGVLVTKCSRMAEQWRDPDEEVEARNVPFLSRVYVQSGGESSRDRVLNDKFRLVWNEWRMADYELRRIRSDYENGRMTEAEHEAAMAAMEADGSLGLWEMVYENGYDMAYDDILEELKADKGDKKAKEDLRMLKRKVVEEAGKMGSRP